LVEPSLDDDPFTSLTPAELVAMGVVLGPSTIGDNEGNSEYEGDDEDDDDE
jgi:hypothetical protein